MKKSEKENIEQENKEEIWKKLQLIQEHLEMF
jgi:hypothetical protein